MKKVSKLKLFELSSILFFLTQGLTLGMTLNVYLKISNVDCWMSPIIGTILGIIPLLIFIKIRNFDESKNINELNKHLFGKTYGNIINFILLLIVTFLIMISLWNLVNFISSQYLYKTPELFITIIFAIPIIYILTKNIIVISRSIVIFFFIELILFTLSALGLIGQIKVHELFPLLENGFIPPIIGGICHIAFVILPIFMLNIFSNDEIEHKDKLNKSIIKSYLFGNIIVFIVVFFNISILGIELLKIYQYPEFQILKRVALGGFIQRIEATLSIHWIISLFVFIIIGCYYIKKTSSQIFNIKDDNKYTKVFSIILFIICIISNYIFANNTIANTFIQKIYTPLAYIFLLGIPITIFITIKFKK